MSPLSRDIEAYERVRDELEREHRGEWAVFHSGEIAGVFPDFELAATEAVERFDRGPYLIRQIGVERIQLSSTLVFRPSHAGRASGI